MRRLPCCRASGGFTLVEVLVALLVMAILAGMAWQGLDTIVRSRQAGTVETERVLRLNTIVAQWEQDLQAVHDTGVVPALAFDGQSLRLTRRVGVGVDSGVALVVWSLRGGTWQRWTAPGVRRSAALREAWLRSQQLVGNEPEQLNLLPAVDWQVYFYRGNSWTNAQSTGDLEVVAPSLPAAAAPAASAASAAAGPASAAAGAAEAASAPAPAPATGAPVAREQLPRAVRLVVRLGSGALTRDVALGPGGS